MAELKTKSTDESVDQFLQQIPDEQKRQDCYTILQMMREASGKEPRMWGEGIIGFGDRHYKYASGREGDWFVVGFSPRKQNISLYLMYGLENYKDVLEKLGKHKIGKGCLYVNKVSDIDLPTLDTMIRMTVKQYNETEV